MARRAPVCSFHRTDVESGDCCLWPWPGCVTNACVARCTLRLVPCTPDPKRFHFFWTAAGRYEVRCTTQTTTSCTVKGRLGKTKRSRLEKIFTSPTYRAYEQRIEAFATCRSWCIFETLSLLPGTSRVGQAELGFCLGDVRLAAGQSAVSPAQTQPHLPRSGSRLFVSMHRACCSCFTVGASLVVTLVQALPACRH